VIIMPKMKRQGKGRASPRNEKVNAVDTLAKQLQSSPVIGVLTLHKMPASALQKMRRALDGKATIKVEKKNMIALALEKAGKKELVESLQGWFGYAQWANTYKFRKQTIEKIEMLCCIIP